ncbi:MAG: DUF3098 domain-containing protein [Fluviicola sp.]|nr:DUF3098 domain-containing protein [Fluviicola sp.]
MSEKKTKKAKQEKVDLLDDTSSNAEGKSLKEFSSSAPFSFNKKNYKLLLIGLAINVLGYFLMIGGANEDPNVFDGEMFSTMRITIAPMLIVAGFGIIIYSIMKKPKVEKK